MKNSQHQGRRQAMAATEGQNCWRPGEIEIAEVRVQYRKSKRIRTRYATSVGIKTYAQAKSCVRGMPRREVHFSLGVKCFIYIGT